MVSISRKALAAMRTPKGILLVTTILCSLIVIAVCGTVSKFEFEPTLDNRNGVLLAFAAEDPSELAGKLTGSDEFPITITVDGESAVATFSGGTVAQALSKAGIVVKGCDLVIPDLADPLEEFDEVVVQRREQVIYTMEQELPFEKFYYYSPQVPPGQEIVKVEGENGLQVDTYVRLLYRGEVDDENLVSQEIVKRPVNEEVMIGFQALPVSSLDFKWPFDENGEPEDYVKVLRARRSAGYSAPAGAGTASGLPAKVGHVAVNPNEIPYGSRLFIQSTDGKHVYGYAIAADTGTALRQDLIDVDLFYASYAASVANGIREVDIYILE